MTQAETLTDRVATMNARLVELDVEFDNIEAVASAEIKRAEEARDDAKAINRKAHEQLKSSLAQIDAIISGVPVTLSGAKRGEGEPILIPLEWEPNAKTKLAIESRGLDYAATLAVYIRQTRESGETSVRWRADRMVKWLDAQASDIPPAEGA